jgi:PEP-CTERM motif
MKNIQMIKRFVLAGAVSMFSGLVWLPAHATLKTVDCNNNPDCIHYKWTLQNPDATQGSGFGNKFTFNNDGGSAVAVTTSGWANTGGTSTSNNAAAQTIQDAQQTIYSGGIGIKNRDAYSYSSSGTNYNYNNTTDIDNVEGSTPEHATDSDQRYDSILLSYTQEIVLTSLTIGWPTDSSYDTDITVLAYDSTMGDPTANGDLAGLTYAQLLTNGWSLIGSYSNLNDNVAQSINAGNVASRYWLVGAYNPLLDNQGWTSGNDYFKLLAAAGEYCKPKTPPPPGVPEPATIGLLGLGFLAMRRFRPRHTA